MQGANSSHRATPQGRSYQSTPQRPRIRHEARERLRPSQPRPTIGDGFFFSSRRRHTRLSCDWSSDVCSSDLTVTGDELHKLADELAGKPGVDMVAPFGTSLHVSGRDREALEATIAPFRERRD